MEVMPNKKTQSLLFDFVMSSVSSVFEWTDGNPHRVALASCGPQHIVLDVNSFLFLHYRPVAF